VVSTNFSSEKLLLWITKWPWSPQNLYTAKIKKHMVFLNYCIRTNIGEELSLANYHAIAKFKPCQYFFYSLSVVTLVQALVAFEWFCQINISPNPLFQQIAKYYIRQYLFLYGISTIDIKLYLNCRIWDAMFDYSYLSTKVDGYVIVIRENAK